MTYVNGIYPDRNGAEQHTLVGRVMAQPEMKASAKGTMYAKFRLGVTDPQDKQYRQTYGVTVFGDAGINTAASLAEGDSVLVVGPVEEREFNGKVYLDVVAREVGVSLRWNEVEVRRTQRTKPAPKPEYVSDDSEPF